MSDLLRRLMRPLPAAPPAVEDRSLERRVAHLEQMVEALQDTSYSQAKRVDAELADLRHRLDPSELAKCLSDHARKRGL